MAFSISINAPGRIASSKGEQLFALAYGSTAITPRNLDQIISQMRSDSVPAGKRRHQPLIITKELGAASPQLLNAHWSSEVLQNVVIQIIGPGSSSGGGQPVVYHTISLNNATIVGHRRYVPGYSKPGAGAGRGADANELEEIQLTFQKITFTNVKGSKTASDDWYTP